MILGIELLRIHHSIIFLKKMFENTEVNLSICLKL